MKDYIILAVDTEGYHLTYPTPYDTKKEAVKAAKEFAKDRRYWAQKAESETFPDEIVAIALLADGEEVDQFPVNFKA